MSLLRSLTLVFESEKLSQDVRSLMRRTFPNFCSPGGNTSCSPLDLCALFLDDDVEGEDLEVSATLADRKDGPTTIEVTDTQVEGEGKEEGEGKGLLMADEGGGEGGRRKRWRRERCQTHPLGMRNGTSWTSILKSERNSNL